MGPNKSEYDDLAGWDNGTPDRVIEQADGHTTVQGTIDGEHYQVSFEKNGDNEHSTLVSPSNGGWWTVDHDTGKEKEK
jgi:hypothetical protein